MAQSASSRCCLWVAWKLGRGRARHVTEITKPLVASHYRGNFRTSSPGCGAQFGQVSKVDLHRMRSYGDICDGSAKARHSRKRQPVQPRMRHTHMGLVFKKTE